MTRQNDQANSAGQKPWRRRISNQLAAFAAVMLFASTQVGTPEASIDLDTAKAQVASQSVLGEIGNSRFELTSSLDQAAGEASHKNSASKKKKAFKLNLFRFRH